MEELAVRGSHAVDGFMNPEGIVIGFGGQLIKKTFDSDVSKYLLENK